MPDNVIVKCIPFGPGWELALQEFLQALDDRGEARFFHPHGSDLPTLRALAVEPRLDLYCLLVEGRRVLGYGLLRGWDAGYAIPSLGIAIHPQARATGLGTFLMDFLERAAVDRGAASIRLRVYRDNAAAIALYTRRGYAWSPDAEDECLQVGMKSVEPGKT